MGQRANLVIVPEGGRYELYYSHWRANTLDSDLFWGPAVALDFIRRQQPTTEWLDERWCEGGAVMDLPRRHLLWFGGEDTHFDVHVRRVLLELMRQFWPGWTVTWASEGVADLARYVGKCVDDVLVERPPPRSLENLFAPYRTNSIVSMRAGDVTRAYAVPMRIGDIWPAGEALCAALEDAPTDGQAPICTDEAEPPRGGIHVDASARRVLLWTAAWTPDGERRLASSWAGWTTCYAGDRFEEHVAPLDGRLAFASRPAAELVENVRTIVLRQPVDFSGTLDAVTNALRAAGKHVEAVNPLGRVDARPAEVGTPEAFERAVAAWSARTP